MTHLRAWLLRIGGLLYGRRRDPELPRSSIKALVKDSTGTRPHGSTISPRRIFTP
jgi:hypothetical protein